MSGSTEVQSLYDTPFPALSHDQLAAVIERHHLAVAPDAVKPMRSTGIVHRVYSLGGSLVLRVPKEHPEAIADAYTGSVAAPVAYAAGVRTPALVAFDDDRDIVAVPYSIFERAPGEPLVLTGAYPQDLGELWADLGRDLALLHSSVRVCDDPGGRLDHHVSPGEHQQLVEDLRHSGVIGDEATSWLTVVLSRLQPATQGRHLYRRFVHGDAQPSNVLTLGSHYSAIIDWDDAGWADPVTDLHYLPLRAADLVLAGYRSIAPMDGDASAEERLLWDKLTDALLRVLAAPAANESISGRSVGPLIETLAAAADGDVGIMRLLRR